MDTCGAKTRAGTPCKQKAIYWNGRCKFHGGLATGPTTEAGKEQSRINGRKGGRPRKAGAVLKDVNVSVSMETEVIEHQGFPKVSPNVQVSARVSDLDAPVVVLGETEIVGTDKTVVSECIDGADLGRGNKSEMSNDVHVLAAQAHPEINTEKPKSWMLREVMVLPMVSADKPDEQRSESESMALGKTHVSAPLHEPAQTASIPATRNDGKITARCQRCMMFASNGACLAVAKGVISAIPSGEECPAFSAF